MNQNIESLLLNTFSAQSAEELETVQSLWSGYGKISRWQLKGSDIKSVIVKKIQAPTQQHHPKGWNSSFSHNRKMKSYQVEMNFYEGYALSCNAYCAVPKCYEVKRAEGEQLLFLEDLNESGYAQRRESLSLEELKVCLSWLANFHATFIQVNADELWEVGTYWHLATRPEEFEKIEGGWLKSNAKAIDQKLSATNFQTLVHGDAKVANFCFSDEMKKVAAVDFQYVGRGCGMKDLIYLMSSCLSAEECELYEEEILQYYFKELALALKRNHKNIDFNDLENEWRVLYPYAWADFVRFLKGWSPEHYKLNDYSERMVSRIMNLE